MVPLEHILRSLARIALPELAKITLNVPEFSERIPLFCYVILSLARSVGSRSAALCSMSPHHRRTSKSNKKVLSKPGAVRLHHTYSVLTTYCNFLRRHDVCLDARSRALPNAFSFVVMSDIFLLRFPIPSPSPVVSRLHYIGSSLFACFYFPCPACLALDCLCCCLG